VGGKGEVGRKERLYGIANVQCTLEWGSYKSPFHTVKDSGTSETLTSPNLHLKQLACNLNTLKVGQITSKSELERNWMVEWALKLI
jgi:hypothetical protein